MKKLKIFQKSLCFFCAMTMIVCSTAPAFASEQSTKQISLQNTNNIASSSHNFMRWGDATIRAYNNRNGFLSDPVSVKNKYSSWSTQPYYIISRDDYVTYSAQGCNEWHISIPVQTMDTQYVKISDKINTGLPAFFESDLPLNTYFTVEFTIPFVSTQWLSIDRVVNDTYFTGMEGQITVG
ncbi:hypothetical protein [Caproicibacterium amylolyticum]|uniref:Uncharacterized protein n=1 Tax=Caproicibacterium amylolyticum TaxID=2766537 RepID=A0A7G9WJ86_9FIRM|nr:hypothetical protein [Caproicibacterium amylolyticum]QNO18748.1 hypothetical protein H6X83_03700 [Caproicibacterium amylolyticum]